MVAEIPAGWSEIQHFFEACAFSAEDRYVDFVRVAPPTSAARDVAVPVTLDEIVESGAWDSELPRSWYRSLPALTKRKEELQGLAVVSDVRIEAWLLHGPRPGGGREIKAFGCAGEDEKGTLLSILVQGSSLSRESPLTISRVSEREVPFSLLESWGFRRADEYVAYASFAGRS